MKKRSKVILLIASHLLAIALGCGGALWYIDDRTEKFVASLTGMAIVSRYAMLVEVNRVQGKEQDYRDALANFLAALEHARTLGDPLFSEKQYHTDRALTYTRLALVEKKLGNGSQSQEYFDKGMGECQFAGWKDCSAERLTWVMQKIEKKGIFGQADEKHN
jgi:hypothetical protein